MKTDDIIKPSSDDSSSHGALHAALGAPALGDREFPSDSDDGEAPGPKASASRRLTGDLAAEPAVAVDSGVEPRAKRPLAPARKLKLRNLKTEQAFELLSAARTADHVELFLRDGRMIDGAILFNDMKGTGRIINVMKEISVDFKADQVRDIRF